MTNNKFDPTYRDPTPVDTKPPTKQLPGIISRLARYIRSKQHGVDVRESIAQGIEHSGAISLESMELAEDTRDKQGVLEARYDVAVGALTEDHEVLDARVDKEGNTHVNLKKRLDIEQTQINKKFEDMVINIRSFGAKIDGVTDDAPAINAALQALAKRGGGTLYLPAGIIRVKSTIVVPSIGVTIETANPYSARISVLDDFVGEEVVRFEQSSWDINKAIGIKGLFINCNNVTAHGITVVNAYDQAIFSNVEIRSCHDNFIGLNFVQSEGQRLNVGQTLILENCIVEHFSNHVTAPAFFFDRYQEVNLIGCKGFASKANSSPGSGTAFHFRDCRGIVLIGCSSAFCENGVVWESTTRTANGLTLTGHTMEAVRNYALKTISAGPGYSMSRILVNPVRVQNGGGSYLLARVNQAVIYNLTQDVTLVDSSVQNTLFSTPTANITNTRGNTVFRLSDHNNMGLTLGDRLQIVADANPQMVLMTSDEKKIRLRYEASSSADLGFKIEKEVGGVYQAILEFRNNRFNFFDEGGNPIASFDASVANNYTNNFLKYTSNGVTRFEQVRLGAMDSGGEGFRTLIVPN